MILESLKSMREKLESNPRFKTYLSGLLLRTLPSEVTEKLIPNINVAIRILEGKPLTKNFYEDSTCFFLTAFNKLMRNTNHLWRRPIAEIGHQQLIIP